jgi:hypothetical protein
MLCLQSQKEYKFKLILLDDREFKFLFKVNTTQKFLIKINHNLQSEIH